MHHKLDREKRTFTEYTRQDIIEQRWHRADTIIFFYDLMQHYIVTNKIKNFKITYTKEKYGRYDITWMWWDKTLDNIVSVLENSTEQICIKCWWKWKLRRDLWWVVPLCTYHYILDRIQFYFNRLKRWLI